MTRYRVRIDHDGAEGEERYIERDGYTEQEVYDEVLDEFVGDAELAGIFVEEWTS